MNLYGLFIISTLSFSLLVEAGKYESHSQANNSTDTNKSFEFRYQKAQQVWDKALRMGLAPEKKESLHRDLEQYDKQAVKWKKLKRDGKDVDGEQEAKLRDQLLVIMKKYGLAGRDTNPNVKIPNLKQAHEPQFDDRRLDKLWHRAKNGQFNEQELGELLVELNHYQEKIDEYKILSDRVYGSNDFNHVREKKPQKKIKEIDDIPLEPKMRRVQELDIKIRHQGIQDSLKKMEMRMIPEEERDVFEEPRVVKMWQEAVAANFTLEELDSIREELRHFESKIQTHEKVKNEAMVEEMKFEAAKASGTPAKSKKHVGLRNQAKEVAEKMNKYYKAIKEKISQGPSHNEL